MTIDEFLDWAEDRPERYELVDGQPVAMAPERVGHTKAKLAAVLASLGPSMRRDCRATRSKTARCIRVGGGPPLDLAGVERLSVGR